VALSQRRQISDDNREEEHELHMDMIRGKRHFNFIKMHLLSHLCDHIRQFGNIRMDSWAIGERAHKTQIKDGGRQSNKNDAGGQIVHSYGRQHAIRMRLLNMESLQARPGDLSAEVLQHLDRATSAVSQPVMRRRILKGRGEDVSNVWDFSQI